MLSVLYPPYQWGRPSPAGQSTSPDTQTPKLSKARKRPGRRNRRKNTSPGSPTRESSVVNASKVHGYQGRRLLTYDKLPEWYQENPSIQRGYRPESRSYHECISSWTYPHNESLNIYTHLLPAIIFVLGPWLLIRYFQTHYPEASFGDYLPIMFFVFTSTMCLGCSAMYHTFSSHSMEISHRCLHIDFGGIVLATLGNFVSGIHVAFYYEPGLQKMYWAMITILSLVTVGLVTNSKIKGREWRWLRTSAFVVTGLSGFAPIAHSLMRYGLQLSWEQSGLPYYLLEGVLFLCGALIFSMRIPEIIKPGRFDIYGSSHQIFHVLVVLAITTHLYGVLEAYEYNYNHRGCSMT
ncbi:hypothetical protein MMC25_006955 [Agyrium rufum]|nr:hypothetical protein [Agyrium rufum]